MQAGEPRQEVVKPVKLLVIGAGGRVGRRLVAGGVARGHEVTAGVHHKDAGPDTPGVRVVVCDVLEPRSLKQAAFGQDVVIVSIDARKPLRPGHLHSVAAENIVAVLRGLMAPRLIWLSSAATGPPEDPNVPAYFRRILRPLLFRRQFDDLGAAERTVAASGLEWTIVHLPRLTNGVALGRYRLGPGYTLSHGFRLSRRDAADFLLKELERRRWIGGHVAIAY